MENKTDQNKYSHFKAPNPPFKWLITSFTAIFSAVVSYAFGKGNLSSSTIVNICLFIFCIILFVFCFSLTFKTYDHTYKAVILYDEFVELKRKCGLSQSTAELELITKTSRFAAPKPPLNWLIFSIGFPVLAAILYCVLGWGDIMDPAMIFFCLFICLIILLLSCLSLMVKTHDIEYKLQLMSHDIEDSKAILKNHKMLESQSIEKLEKETEDTTHGN